MLGWLFGSVKKASKSKGSMGDIVTQAAQFLTEALQSQMTRMDGIERDIPRAATDGFSLGYIAGFTESVATMRNIDSEQNGYVVHHAVFTDLFGPQQGPLLFATFMKKQNEGDEEILMGMTIGGEDMFAWLNGDVEAPMRWAEYVNKNE